MYCEDECRETGLESDPDVDGRFLQLYTLGKSTDVRMGLILFFTRYYYIGFSLLVRTVRESVTVDNYIKIKIFCRNNSIFPVFYLMCVNFTN